MAFIRIDSLTECQINDLLQMYHNEWWSTKRTVEDIKKMLKHSQVHIAFIDEESNRLAGFCRMITDYVYKAVIMDVIVSLPYRKTGLGTKLMDAAVNHPDIKSVESVDLWCLEELVPFYERWQFTNKLGKIRFMRRNHQGNVPIPE